MPRENRDEVALTATKEIINFYDQTGDVEETYQRLSRTGGAYGAWRISNIVADPQLGFVSTCLKKAREAVSTTRDPSAGLAHLELALAFHAKPNQVRRDFADQGIVLDRALEPATA